MRINGAMFQMSQTNPQLPVPNDHRYTQNIQDIISHINNHKQMVEKNNFATICLAYLYMKVTFSSVFRVARQQR